MYTGGEVRIEKDLSQIALGPTPFPNLAHLVVGFQVYLFFHLFVLKVFLRASECFMRILYHFVFCKL